MWRMKVGAFNFEKKRKEVINGLLNFFKRRGWMIETFKMGGYYGRK
jgi:hypothetical protein